MIEVTGSGTQEDPFVIGLEYQDERGCAAVVACISERIGPGLEVVGGELQLKLSPQPNHLSFDQSATGNRGLFAFGELPGPADCPGRSVSAICQPPGSIVAGAPATLAVGAQKMGFLSGPTASIHSLRHMISQGLDILHVHTAASKDGVACITEYEVPDLVEVRNNVVDQVHIADIPSSVFTRFVNYAGGSVNNGSMADNPVAGTSGQRRGGWWGWRTQGYGNMTMAQLLHEVDSDAVVIGDCQNSSSLFEQNNVTALARAVDELCSQAWTMAGVSTIANATRAITLGMTPILINTMTEVEKDTTTPPWPVASVVAAGIEWVALDKQYNNTVFAAYSNAGVHVIASRVERHYERTRFEQLKAGEIPGLAAVTNLCGYLSHDPVYTRGPAVREYRVESDPYQDNTVAPGALTHQTSRGIFTTYNFVPSRDGTIGLGGMTSPGARGFCKDNDAGLYLDRNFGAYALEEDLDLPDNRRRNTGGIRSSVLAGWACPLSRPTGYTITFEIKIDETATPSDSSGKMGLLFGAPDDRDIYGWPNYSPYRPEPGNCYRAYVRVNGRVGLGIWRNNVYSYISGTTETDNSASTERTTAALSPGVWYRCQLVVTEGDISFTARIGAAPTATVTARNTRFRGPYFFLEKEQLGNAFAIVSPGAPPTNRFAGAFRNINVTYHF